MMPNLTITRKAHEDQKTSKYNRSSRMQEKFTNARKLTNTAANECQGSSGAQDTKQEKLTGRTDAHEYTRRTQIQQKLKNAT